MPGLAPTQNEKIVLTNNANDLKALIGQIIFKNTNENCIHWLNDCAGGVSKGNGSPINPAFAIIPRKTGRNKIEIKEEAAAALHQLRQNFIINEWSIDRLCRVWLLLHLETTDRMKYIHTIERLFMAAEMNEQVALYGALPVLAYPEYWHKRCAEGIRSNIGIVLESIMCNNPYPAEQLEQPSWNQMVLKAFFTEKPVYKIIGLDERRNKELAGILSDYSHERWAAGRPVNPMLWRCMAPFIDEKIFPDIERLASSTNEPERKAAFLACLQSDYQPAKILMNTHPALQPFKENTGMSWNALIAE